MTGGDVDGREHGPRGYGKTLRTLGRDRAGHMHESLPSFEITRVKSIGINVRMFPRWERMDFYALVKPARRTRGNSSGLARAPEYV
jgi:hypothetical protein